MWPAYAGSPTEGPGGAPNMAGLSAKNTELLVVPDLELSIAGPSEKLVISCVNMDFILEISL